MPASSFWLRLLLSFAIILNGSVAVGAVMPSMGSAGGAAPTATASSDAMDCHEEIGLASAYQQDAVSTTNGTDHPDRHSTPDCCKPGSCQCACAHVTTTLTVASPEAAMLDETPLTVIASNNDIAKRLSRLDRPPIG